MLAISLTLLGLYLVLDQLFKYTPCVIDFTELISGLFGNGPVNKNQTLCVTYFTRFIMGSSCNEPVNKSRHYVLANSLH